MSFSDAADLTGLLEVRHRPLKATDRLTNVSGQHRHRLTGLRTNRLVELLTERGDLRRRSATRVLARARRTRLDRRTGRCCEGALQSSSRCPVAGSDVRLHELFDLLGKILEVWSRCHAERFA